MTRFIITTSDSGAGCLKASGIAEGVLGLAYELVHGPAPASATLMDFFAERTALWPAGTEDWEIEATNPKLALDLMSAAKEAYKLDSVELWIDPIPNSQLLCAQMIDWLARDPHVSGKFYCCFLDLRLGVQTPEWVAKFDARLAPIDARITEIATAVWSSFCENTPQSFSELLLLDFHDFPRFTTTIRGLLAELPDAHTGLLATQRNLLEMVSLGFDTPRKLLSHQSWCDGDAVFGYWERGRLLCELALCATPALNGMNGENFTLDLHNDYSRLMRFWNSNLSLTTFGQALLKGTMDYSRFNRVDRWWGGTRLTNLNLWRWDVRAQRLLQPR